MLLLFPKGESTVLKKFLVTAIVYSILEGKDFPIKESLQPMLVIGSEVKQMVKGNIFHFTGKILGRRLSLNCDH
jgi:hypothetical protein